MTRRWIGAVLGLLLAGCQVAEAPAGLPTGVFTLAAVGTISPEPSAMPTESPVVAPTVAVPTPSASPTPSFGGKGGSGGGGSRPVPVPVPAELELDTGFRAQRIAGAAEGGDALGTDRLTARFMGISGLVVAPDGTLYVADPVRHEVRALPPAGASRVVAGTGVAAYTGENVPADASALSSPLGLVREPLTGAIVVADAGNDRIRLFTPGGRIYTLAGGGAATTDTVTNPLSARLARPTGLAADGTGRVYFSERTSGKVRQVAASGGVSTLGTLTANATGAVAARWDGARVWAAEGDRVRVLRPGSVPVLEPTPVATFTDREVTGLAYDQAGGLYVLVTTPATGGRAGTQVFRLAVGDDGLMPADRVPEPVAGTGGTEADATAYQAPAVEVPDAATVLLGGAWQTQLAIDLTAAADPSQLAGQLYLGSSLDDGATRFGQVVKLTPRE